MNDLDFTGNPISDEAETGAPVCVTAPVHSEQAEASLSASVARSTGAVSGEREADVSRLAAGAGIALGGKLIGRTVRLGVDVVLAHILGPASFGLYAIGWVTIRLITLVSPLGLDSGVIRFASPCWKQDQGMLKGVMNQSLELSTFSGLVLGVLFYFLAPWLGETVFSQPMLTPVFRGFAFALPLITCLRVASAATRVSQRMKFSVYAEEICPPALALLLIVAFYLCGMKLDGVLIAFVFSFGLSLILAIHYMRQLFPEIASEEVKPVFAGKELFLFSLPASFSIVFGMLLLWVDRLFVGYYRSSVDAGIYHAASQLSIALAVVLSAFGAIITPMIAQLFHRGRKERLEELFRVSTKWSLYVSIPPFLLMCFVPHEIMSVIFGKAYGIGWIALPILGLGQLINSGTGPVGTLLVMTGSQNRISALTGLMLLANIVAAIWLVPRWGMLGAAIGTMSTVSALCILSVWMAQRTLGVWPYDRRYIKGAAAAIFTTVALLLVNQLPVRLASLQLACAAIVSITVFAIALILLGLDSEDREFIGLILNRLLPETRSRQIMTIVTGKDF